MEVTNDGSFFEKIIDSNDQVLSADVFNPESPVAGWSPITDSEDFVEIVFKNNTVVSHIVLPKGSNVKAYRVSYEGERAKYSRTVSSFL